MDHPSNAARYRVLVVDDNHDCANSLSELLGALGAEARAAYDAGSALALMGQFDPELVIADLSMPGIRGDDLARLIRADNSRSNTMLIAAHGAATRARGFWAHFGTDRLDLDTAETVAQQRL
ncbi:MAG: response regulator [Pseudomonadales bacterium]